MGGAIIPNDWDGSTYDCYRVNWPQSLQYEAILLGSVSEPAWSNFWDPETGDEQEAAEAIETAYRVTSADMWTKECDEPVLVPTFQVKKLATQTVTAGSWQTVSWEGYEWNKNAPGFDLFNETHTPPLDQMGLWHYDVILAMTVSGEVSLRAVDFVTDDIISRAGKTNLMVQMSFNYVWVDQSVEIGIKVYPAVTGAIFAQNYLTNFAGFYVGPVD